jgi:hypothetical protein
MEYLPLVLRADMTSPDNRASCWSVTINNPTAAEVNVILPSGWTLTGQYEVGEEGTKHFQGMLKTPQVRFSAVKKQFPRAHIEVARNQTALKQYVDKEETRVASFGGNESPTIFQYQDIIADDWNDEEYAAYCEECLKTTVTDPLLGYIDLLCSRRIADGARALEFVSVNPIWRSSWKRFASAIVKRRRAVKSAEDKSNVVV